MNPEIQLEPPSNHPKVSVIIPARNEEANLERCLRSLVVQEGVSFEIIVVDDNSTDRTRAIAESFTRVGNCPVVGHNSDRDLVHVVSALSPLPDGWTGKANAVWTGARLATGTWLLFTDADTEHLPGSLAASFKEAEEHGCALLSYSPEQEVSGFLQCATMPVIFAELASTYQPRKVCDPNSDAAAANGQYLLIRRDWYSRIGGHAAVASSLLEDVALARVVKRSGGRLRFRLGKGLVRTRMYHTWPEMREGWTKNLALLFQRPELLAQRRLLEFGTIVALIAFAATAAGNGWYPPATAAAACGLAVWIRFLRRIRKAHFGLPSTAVAICGLPVFAWLLLRSKTAHKSRHVTWSGRTYDPLATGSASGISNTVEQQETRSATGT